METNNTPSGIRVRIHTDHALSDSEIKIEPRTVWVTEFDSESARKFSEEMHQAHTTGQTVIPVIVDSYGGDTYSLMSMVAEIAASELPVATIARGKAMSAGCVLVSAGTPGYRYADPECTFMLHEVSSATWGKVEDVKSDAYETQRINRRMLDLMDKYCNQESGYFHNLIHQNSHADLYFTAKQALKHGIVDRVKIPQLTVEVNCEWTLS